MERINYVLGFAFTKTRDAVLLIEKKRPTWQAGTWNGIGGKIEPGEDQIDAMCREFREECGLDTNSVDWSFYANMYSDKFQIFCYYTFLDNVLMYRSPTDEVVDLWNLNNLSYPPLQHALSWLIPLALDRAKEYHYGVNVHIRGE